MSSATLLNVIRNWTLHPQSNDAPMAPNSWDFYTTDSGNGHRASRQHRSSRAMSTITDITACTACHKCCPWPRRRIPNENLLVLSLIQVLCGIAAVILSGVSISKAVFLSNIGTGVWTGAVMVATGSHGIVTARRKGPCTLITLLVLCVISTITATILTCLSTAGLIADSMARSHPSKAQLIMMHALLLIVGLLESSIAVTTAILCCRQVCCGHSDTLLHHSASAAAAARTFVIAPDGYLLGGEHGLALRMPASYLSVSRSHGRESSSLLVLVPSLAAPASTRHHGSSASGLPDYTASCLSPSLLSPTHTHTAAVGYPDLPPSYRHSEQDLPPVSPGPPPPDNYCYIPGNPDHFSLTPCLPRQPPPSYPDI